jgi:hypothetical protein
VLVRLRRRLCRIDPESAERAVDALIARESELFKVATTTMQGLDTQATGVTAAVVDADGSLARLRNNNDSLRIKRAVPLTWTERRLAADRVVARKTKLVLAAVAGLLGAVAFIGVLLIVTFDVLVESLLY